MFLKAFDDSEEKISCNCQHNNSSRDNEPCCRCDSWKRNMLCEGLSEFICKVKSEWLQSEAE